MRYIVYTFTANGHRLHCPSLASHCFLASAWVLAVLVLDLYVLRATAGYSRRSVTTPRWHYILESAAAQFYEMFLILKKTDLQRFGFSRRVPRRRGRPVGPVGCTCGRICAALWVTAGALRVCRTLENTCWPHCRLQRRSTMWSLLSNISNGFSDDEFANGCLLLRACAEGKVELVKQMIGEAPKLLVSLTTTAGLHFTSLLVRVTSRWSKLCSNCQPQPIGSMEAHHWTTRSVTSIRCGLDNP